MKLLAKQNPQSCLFALLLNEALLHPEGSEAQLYINRVLLSSPKLTTKRAGTGRTSTRG